VLRIDRRRRCHLRHHALEPRPRRLVSSWPSGPTQPRDARQSRAALPCACACAAWLLLACNGATSDATANAPSQDAAEPIAADEPETPVAPKGAAGVEGITAAGLRAHVEALAADELAGRETPSPQLDRAAAYIADRFAAAELAPLPAAPEYRQTFPCGQGASPSSNVLARLPGREPREAIVVGAHYDHVGTRSARPGTDGIYNGANDNASGVAAMLEIARTLAASDALPRRSVVFIAFCGEELGLRGSKHYVANPAWPLEDTVAVVNLEMLGRAASGSARPTVWITGKELSDLGDAFADADTLGVEFVASTTVGPREASTFRRSDNYPFAEQGVVAHTFAAGRLDDLYHSPDDEIDTMNFDAMTAIVRGLARAIRRLADSDDHPDWTDEGRAKGLH
jgi:Zn-dependent M28 family amino/carboxypeptidase